MISVIVPLYNKGGKLCRTVESVLKQDYDDFELLIIDDGSTDNSSDYLRRYSDSRIHYYKKENGGVSSARNYGCKVAKGEWLLFLDADDEILKNALSFFVSLHRKYPSSRFLVGMTKWVRNGNVVGEKKPSGKMISSNHPYLDIWMRKYYPGTRNMLVHRSLVEEYGGFDERMSFYEDWEFTLRLAGCGNVAFVSEYVGVYNQDETGLSALSHDMKRDMAFYVPELMTNSRGIMKAALLYENVEETKAYYSDHSAQSLYYSKMQNDNFAWYFRSLHWVRQQLVRHHFI